MTAQTSTLADALLASARAAGAPIEVAITVRIEAYDHTTQTATIRPCVRGSKMDRDGNLLSVEATAIPGIPVLHLAAGGRSFTLGLSVGDYATAVVRSRSHDEVDSGTATPVTAASSRRWNWSDAVVIPAYRPPADPLPASAVRADGQPVMALGALEALHVGIATASIALARADLVKARIDTLQAAHDTHIHTVATVVTNAVPVAPGPVTGAGNSGVPTVLVGPLAGVATSRVLVDD